MNRLSQTSQLPIFLYYIWLSNAWEELRENCTPAQNRGLARVGVGDWACVIHALLGHFFLGVHEIIDSLWTVYLKFWCVRLFPCCFTWLYSSNNYNTIIIIVIYYFFSFVQFLSFVLFFPSAGDGEVYVWDMNTRRCVHKFRDEGCLKSTTLSASRDGQYLACGWVSFPLVHECNVCSICTV